MAKSKYFFFLLFLLSLNALFANEPLISKKKAPLSVALPLLKSIDHHAVLVGNGPVHMYAFIDPVCPRSQEFLEMILENKNMQDSYTYHFFYYELARFHSKKLIGTIYAQKEPLNMMKQVMIEKREVPILKDISSEIQSEIDDISRVAEKLEINKRPYLFVVKPQKEGE